MDVAKSFNMSKTRFHDSASDSQKHLDGGLGQGELIEASGKTQVPRGLLFWGLAGPP